MVDGAGGDRAWRLTASGNRKSAAAAQQGIKRLFEQAVLVLLLLLIVWVFLEKARDVRSAAELSAVQSNLGAMRSAIMIDRINRAAKFGQAVQPLRMNPFLLLARPPTNYLGEMTLEDAVGGELKPGFWFFDKASFTIGYRVEDSRQFFSRSGGKILLFRPATQELLSASEAYVWRGVVVN